VNKRGALVVAVVVAAMLTPAAAEGAVSSAHSGWFWGNPLPQGKSVYDVAFSGERGYAVGDFGTVLRTDDGGASWNGLSTGITVDLRHVRAIGPDSFVAAGGCALRRSDDGGQSFQRLPWTASDARCSSQIAAVFYPSSSVGYLLLDNGNVLRTQDGGKTWSRRTAVPNTRAVNPSSPARPGDLFFTDENTGIAAIGAGLIYRTDDGGSTWTLVSNPPHEIRGLWFTDPSHGYAVGDHDLVIVTNDGGRSWQPLAHPPSKDDLLTIRCADRNTCLITTRGGRELIRTTNGGASFASISPANRKLFGVAYASHDRAVALGESGTTVISDNSGATFHRVGGDLAGSFTDLRAASPSVAYAFGPAGSLARTSDGGATWEEMDAATSDRVVDVSFPQTAIGFALDSVGQLLRTDNGGQSYEILNTGTTRAPDAVLALDGKRVLLVGPVGMRRSVNGGDSFKAVRQTGVTRAGFGDVGHVGDFVYAWGSRAIAASTNAGATWHRVHLPVAIPKHKHRRGHHRPADIEKIDFVSARRGYALYSDGRLFVTGDRGHHWRQLLGMGTETGYDFDFSDSRHGYLTVEAFGDDTAGYVLETDDGGATWEPQLIDAENLRTRGLASVSPDTGFALSESNHLFGSASAGSRGSASTLSISTHDKRLKKPGTARIDGKLSPARGGEQVVVSVRQTGDPRWAFETVPVAANGTFTVFAPLKRSALVVAQWAGDDTHHGDGTGVLRIHVKKKRKAAAHKASAQPLSFAVGAAR
jgi:photosystem II stability/assembly factor-like uncharacterized protein